MKYIENLKQLEAIVEKHKDRLKYVKRKDGLDSKRLETEYQNLQDSKRLLKIGIVGRVKAGKSSLLNALIFDGQNILPKAATPMTAALTKLEYYEKFAFQVDFFDKDDIAKIKQGAKDYEDKLAERIQIEKQKLQEQQRKNQEQQGQGILARQRVLTPKEIDEMAQRKAQTDMKNTQLYTLFDQYQRMRESGVNESSLDSKKLHECKSLDDFQKELTQYVGSSGKYMPYTKSVTLKMPYESLKDVEIVDTPGLNDPVASRSARTTEMLSECDVIFIVSPTWQFMSSEDLNLMVNSITKEGIAELYVIASQADNTLNESSITKRFKDIKPAMERVSSISAQSLSQALSGENAEIFGDLIKESSKRLICSSGIAISIKRNINNLSNLDSSESKALENLQKNYKNDFPANNKAVLEANLDFIANIARVKEVLQ